MMRRCDSFEGSRSVFFMFELFDVRITAVMMLYIAQVFFRDGFLHKSKMDITMQAYFYDFSLLLKMYI